MPRIQKLITAELAATLPKLYAQEEVDDAIVYAKFFTPYTGWTWLVTEYSPSKGIAFGFCYNAAEPDGAELGYINVIELQGMRNARGWQAVERDAHFTPKPLSEAKDAECPGLRRAA